MANSSSGGRKPALAQVVHFPKRKGARPAEARRSRTPTDPRHRGFEEELITEPGFVLPGAGDEPTRSNADKPIWVNGNATLEHHKGQVKALLASRKGKGKKHTPLPGPAALSPKKIAERSMYGHELFQLGRLEEAREVFEELVGLGVEQAYAHTMLGTIYLALDQQDRALELFEIALALESTDIAARVYRGEIRLNRGKLHLAIDDLQLAVRLGDAEDPFVERAKRLIQLARTGR